jgi:hypothetical protein
MSIDVSQDFVLAKDLYLQAFQRFGSGTVPCDTLLATHPKNKTKRHQVRRIAVIQESTKQLASKLS